MASQVYASVSGDKVNVSFKIGDKTVSGGSYKISLGAASIASKANMRAPQDITVGQIQAAVQSAISRGKRSTPVGGGGGTTRRAAPSKTTPRKTGPDARPDDMDDWIADQVTISPRVKSSATRARDRKEAADRLFKYSRFVDGRLQSVSTRTNKRTKAQKSATIALFRALQQDPTFDTYRKSVTAEHGETRPEFKHIAGVLRSSSATVTVDGEKVPTIPDNASSSTIQAADMLIRSFLFDYAANRYASYGSELGKLSDKSKERLKSAQEAETKSSDRARTQFLRTHVFAGAMDSDTLIAGMLWMRRHELVKEKKTKQSQVASWNPPSAVSNITIVVLGASIAGSNSGAIATQLEKLIQGKMAKGRTVSAETVATDGHTSSGMLSRFDSDVGDGWYDTVIISGTAMVNEEGGDLDGIKKRYGEIMEKAHKRGMRIIVYGVIPHAGYIDKLNISDDAKQKRHENVKKFNAWLEAVAKKYTHVIYVDLSSMGVGDPPKLSKIYDRGDGLHTNAKGSQRIAEIIHAVAYLHKPAAKAGESLLEKYAKKYWKKLDEKIFTAVGSGRPGDLVGPIRKFSKMKVRRSLPSNKQTIEGALEELGRTDVEDAFIKIYNEVLLAPGSEFREFLRTTVVREFRGLAAVKISKTTSSRDMRRVVRAVQTYINETAKGNEQWQKTYKEELRELNRTLLPRDKSKQARDDVHVSGEIDLRTLSALALLRYRRKNVNAPKLGWARNMPGVTVDTEKEEPKGSDRKARPMALPW